MHNDPLNHLGPQRGYAAVVAGTPFFSRERRPAEALGDIQAQVGQHNLRLASAGSPIRLTAPTRTGQLHNWYTHSNPHLMALLCGEAIEPRVVSCTSNACALPSIAEKARANRAAQVAA
jgi:hypothetical protein